MDLETVILILTMLLVYGSPVILFFGAWWIGSVLENRHYKSIRTREAELLRLPAVPIRTPVAGRVIVDARLVTGSVVIANDYFKKFLAGLRKIFGGRLRSYESLIDRARREAVLRMKESCPDADAILNLRLETSTISCTNRDGGMGAVEVIAYGTAIRYQ